MSFMIEELVADLSYVNRSWLRCYPPKNALARSRYKPETISGGDEETMENRTIPMGP